jgi:hypothetical protein
MAGMQAISLSGLCALPGAAGSGFRHTRDTNGQRTSSSGGGSSKQAGSSIPRLPAGPTIRHSKLVQSHGTLKSPNSSSANGGSSISRQPLHSKQQPQQQTGTAAGPLRDSQDDTQGWGDGDVSYEAIMQQQMRQQDEVLDHISVHVDRIKHTGQLMHEELEEQVRRQLTDVSSA